MQKWLAKLNLNGLQIFQLIRFSTTLLIGILLVKVFQLSTADIAVYEILLFLGNFFSFFWLSATVKSLLSEYGNAKQSFQLLVNLSLLLLIMGLFFGGILYFFEQPIIQSLTQYRHLENVGLIALYIIFTAPSTLIEYIYLLQKKEQQIVNYGSIIYTLQLISIVLPLTLGFSLTGIFTALLIWSIFKFIWLIFLLLNIYKAKGGSYLVSWQLQKKILLLIFPLSLHMLIGGGMEYIDGFIVAGYFTDTSQFAIFRYGARELPLVTILTSALTATLIPLAVENKLAVQSKVKEEVGKLTKWLYPVTFLLMLLSPYLFPLVYSNDFAESASVFNIYLLIISSRILLPQVFIYAAQQNYILVLSAIIEVITNLSLSLILVNHYGLAGIAIATVIAYLLNKILLMIYVHTKLNLPPSKYLNINKYFQYNLLLLAVFYVSTQL